MKGKIGGIATGIIIALIIIIGLACTERIPAGYVGVVYNMNGGIEDKVLTQGWKFVSPTKKVTKFSIALLMKILLMTELQRLCNLSENKKGNLNKISVLN